VRSRERTRERKRKRWLLLLLLLLLRKRQTLDAALVQFCILNGDAHQCDAR